jgi:crossover junction endodeoxyribonuclease RusA
MSKKETKLKLPYPVSANIYWRTRVITPRGGKPMAMTYVSQEAKSYKSIVAWTARAAGAKPVTVPIKLEICLCPKRNKGGEASKVRLDLSNCIKVLEDALNGVAYADDKQVVEINATIGEPHQDGAVYVTISEYEYGGLI